MSLWQLALKSLWNRRLSVGLTVFAIAVSVALLLTVERVRHESRSSFAQTVSGVDMIVGARGGSSQLLLYSVFRLGEATGNFSWGTFEKLRGHPQVAWAIPVSLGDSHRGYRVLATDNSYFAHYRTGDNRPLVFASTARPKTGTTDTEPAGHFSGIYDVVAGSEVARKLGYSIGDTLVLSHGIAENALSDHSDRPFTLTGILEPTGTPVDRTLHITLAGMEALHVDWQNGAPPLGPGLDADTIERMNLTPTSITAAFVGLKSRLAVFSLQRGLNTYPQEPLSAILPGVALAELWQSFALMERILLLVSACVVGAGLLGLLAVMLTSLNERRRELAILRAVGARPRHIFSLLMLESGLVGLAGVATGLLLFHALLLGLRPWLASEFGLFIGLRWPAPNEWLILAAVVLAAFVSGLLPALRAYRNLLVDGLTPRV
ncbi:MAG: ABC transporter permease [Moraxellaceae bacterium]|nr:ABC transporter permease [Moraxellaceae bacterium]